MTRREYLQEQYEDSLFALLMDDVAEAEGEKALEELERLNADPDAAVPEELKRKCYQTIDRYFAARSGRRARRAVIRGFRHVAVAVLVCMLLFSAAFAAVPEVRSSTLNFMIRTFDDHAELKWVGDALGLTPPAQETRLHCGWLPEGFELTEELADSVSISSRFENADAYILVRWTTATNSFVDTEDASIEEMDINGYSATVISKTNYCNVIWADAAGGYCVKIFSEGVSKEDTLRVAEQLEIELPEVAD